MGSDFISWHEPTFVLNDRIGTISGGITIDDSGDYYRWAPFPSGRGYELMISTDGTTKCVPATRSGIVRETKAAQVDTEDDFNDFEVGDLDELLSNE